MSGTDRPVQRFISKRPGNIRSFLPWSPYAYVAWRLRQCISALVTGAEIGPDGRVLDFGCDTKPYRDLFSERTEYLGVDLPGNPHADLLLGPDGRVPVDDGSIELVLSTQVLEHVDDPARYLQESMRVLAPGGCMVLTTHGIMHLHRDPQDYWRWTSDGLEKIVRDEGFEVEATRGVLGLVPVGVQLIQAGVAHRIPRLLIRPFVVLCQVLIAITDLPSSDAARRDFGLVIGLRARKPTEPMK